MTFETKKVLARYETRLKKIWDADYELFCNIVCRLSSREEADMKRRYAAIIETVKNGGNVVIILPEKDLPERCADDVYRIGALVRDLTNEQRYAFLILSGGVTTTVGKNGQVEDRLKLCGEMDARRMAAYFNANDRNLAGTHECGYSTTIFRWDGNGVFEDTASRHAGHQATILPPVLLAYNTTLIVLVGAVEQNCLRLSGKLAAGIDKFAQSFTDEGVKKWRQNLRMVVFPAYPLDGNGWDGKIGRHISAAEDAFGEERPVSDDHTAGGETDKVKKEISITKPCPNMSLQQMLHDSLFEFELADLTSST